jgi:hypothetical protein
MIDDDTEIPEGIGDAGRALYYDYFKWITTLSLVAIGGVFSLVTQSKLVFKPLDLFIALGFLALAAVTGLTGVEAQIALSREPQKLAKKSKFLKSVAMFALGAGAGYFIIMFSDRLFA